MPDEIDLSEIYNMLLVLKPKYKKIKKYVYSFGIINCIIGALFKWYLYAFIMWLCFTPDLIEIIRYFKNKNQNKIFIQLKQL